MRKVLGFTLIELMVTIAVLAIIAMIAVPSFKNLVARKHLDSSIRELSFVLSEARVKATTLRTNTHVKFQSGQTLGTQFFWQPQYNDLTLQNDEDDIDISDVTFSAIGIPKQRSKWIANPICKELPEGENCEQPIIQQILPLKFKLCHIELHESKTIELSTNGTVSSIYSGVC